MIQLIVRSRAFHSEILNSSGEFSLFFQKNLDFKHSPDTKMRKILEEEETKMNNFF